MKEIAEEINSIDYLMRRGRCDEALTLSDKLVAKYPDCPEALATRAYVNQQRKEYHNAIADWSRAITFCNSEPHYYYTRGRNYFWLQKFHEAVSDFTKTIELCDTHHSNYYRYPAHLLRADAYLRLRQLEKAKADCMCVPEGMDIWTDKLTTREEILRACEK